MLLPRFLFVVSVLSIAYTARHHFRGSYFDGACDNETVSQGVSECLEKMPERAQLIVKVCGSALTGDTVENNDTLTKLCENRDLIPKFAHCVGRVAQDIFDFADHLHHHDYDHHHHRHHDYYDHDHSDQHHHEHDHDDFDMHAHEGQFHADVHYHGHHDHHPHDHNMVHPRIFKKFQEFIRCFKNSLPEEIVDNSTSSSNDELSEGDYYYYD